MIENSVNYNLQQKIRKTGHICYYGNVNALNFLLEKFPELIPVINKALLMSEIKGKQFRVLNILLKKICNYKGYTVILSRIESETTFESVNDEITFYTNIIHDIP